jgi:membrane-associated phospholipid phosphatase
MALGLGVDRYGEPAALWAFDRAVVDHGAILAWWITQLGRFYVLAPLALALSIAAWLLPSWRGRILFSLVMLLLAWRAADFFQHVFARPRRLDWVLFHETSFSYPSSHATIATAFYALWAWLFARGSTARSRGALCTLALIAVVAICWSRLALGAHYVTDVAGGVLLGLTLLAAGAAVWPEILAGTRKGRA